jgi:hypothetical protein
VSHYQERQTFGCLGRGGEILGGCKASSLVGSSRVAVCHMSLVFFCDLHCFVLPSLMMSIAWVWPDNYARLIFVILLFLFYLNG